MRLRKYRLVCPGKWTKYFFTARQANKEFHKYREQLDAIEVDDKYNEIVYLFVYKDGAWRPYVSWYTYAV